MPSRSSGQAQCYKEGIMTDLPKIKPTRKSGDEPFLELQANRRVTLQDFWQWSSSDLVCNVTRGILAEYFVAVALGLDGAARTEWDTYDLKSASGLRIEVKSAAYVQSWYQRCLSRITFSIRPTLAFDSETNTYEHERKRHADVYVFCVLHHKDRKTINPMDLSQWTFYAISTRQLELTMPQRKSITLGKLQQLGPVRCSFCDLRTAIEHIEQSLQSQ